MIACTEGRLSIIKYLIENQTRPFTDIQAKNKVKHRILELFFTNKPIFFSFQNGKTALDLTYHKTIKDYLIKSFNIIKF